MSASANAFLAPVPGHSLARNARSSGELRTSIMYHVPIHTNTMQYRIVSYTEYEVYEMYNYSCSSTCVQCFYPMFLFYHYLYTMLVVCMPGIYV